MSSTRRGTDLDELLGLARKAAAGAAVLARSAQSSPSGNIGAVRTKSGPRDLVTVWDTRCEELIRAELEAGAPGISILGEEGGESGTGDGRDRWLVDPIDGTYNFAHGLPLYAVSIALERDGEPVLGVVNAPALGYEFHASVEGGAFEGDNAVHVSLVESLGESMLATGFASTRAETAHNFAEWNHFQKRAGACRRLGAASLDLCFVACGWLDGYWETRLSPWDLAAGAVIVREASGMVTDITGEPFRVRSGNAIASNGAIHREILHELEIVDGVIRD